ncbi:PfkB family carbohydrate kinase [Mumia zhuanghuii]|uniref:Bifunctional heptose 7-phosphate kinase/heptose 1-phosphate adenyltransferase n=1 Tax=Mumia zhuanghuii TaxID=2585211 RepID=A0A5C4MLZ7_9ACTN|nr:PfkB family carbohydrate kinase [Mumia zhuanghuii]TNC36594.1 bifunctional heptose 7-phosphate kinase/heptose 1-phosphate adenyltransferase [Mumia zhuanghuii]TNC46353.1 bifunctional heptose 7-phosphate kinase/heptose 1-phosphate adenyltransferase [Mumia zhuanghuii]
MSACIVVVGEALLDVDLVGAASRLSPDAPVAVVDEPEERPRPGGAALAAAMAAADGAHVVLATPLSDDDEADRLRTLLPSGVEVVALPSRGSTPVKRRVVADGHVLVRLDSGGTSGRWSKNPSRLTEALASADAVLVSDYGRGLTYVEALRAALTEVSHRTPVVWDPHRRGAPPVPGTWLLVPNQSELAHLDSPDGPPATSLGALGDAARRVRDRLGPRALAVTLGERGSLLVHGDSPPVLVAAEPVSGSDACGAGDRFASAAAVRLARGDLVSEAVEHGTRAAADFVARGGAAALAVAPPPAEDHDEHLWPRRSGQGAPVLRMVDRVRARGGVVVATGGCFDLLHAGHVATLEAARRLGDCLVVLLNSDASVQSLKGPGRPLVPQDDRARVLESLGCVDAVVVFDELRPDDALRDLRPDLWIKGGDYAGGELPEEKVLADWGGRCLVLPYVNGRSTTRLVAAANGSGRADSTHDEEELR